MVDVLDARLLPATHVIQPDLIDQSSVVSAGSHTGHFTSFLMLIQQRRMVPILPADSNIPIA